MENVLRMFSVLDEGHNYHVVICKLLKIPKSPRLNINKILMNLSNEINPLNKRSLLYKSPKIIDRIYCEYE
jgi:hypothetical protein